MDGTLDADSDSGLWKVAKKQELTRPLRLRGGKTKHIKPKPSLKPCSLMNEAKPCQMTFSLLEMGDHCSLHLTIENHREIARGR